MSGDRIGSLSDLHQESGSGILISPRIAEQYVRNRGMKRVVSPVYLALLTAACVLPASFLYWQYIPQGNLAAGWMTVIFAGFSVIIITFLAAVCELGSVFPSAGGVYTFARQETGVLGGYIAGMAAAVIHLCLGAFAMNYCWHYLLQSLPPNLAFFLLAVVVGVPFLVAGYRTDYYLFVIFVVFCSALAAVLLFFIALGHAGLFSSQALLQGTYLATPWGLLILFFVFSGVAGLASVAEELEMRNRKWHLWILGPFILMLGIVLLQIMFTESVNLSRSPHAFLMLDLLVYVYPDDYVLRDTFRFFGFAALILPVFTGLYLVSRQFFAFARSGYLPVYFGKLRARRQTPLRSLTLGLILMIALACWHNPMNLLEMAGYSFCVEIILVLYSWWRMQSREPGLFSVASGMFRWLVFCVVGVTITFFIILALGQVALLFLPIMVWFVLIMYVYYRGGSFIRDEAPDEAIALQKEKGTRVDFH